MDYTYKTNKYRKPLLNICGVTGQNKTLNLGVAFVSGESEEDYSWALSHLKGLLHSERISEPSIFVTDRDRALLNALRTHFPSVPTLICAWHQAKDVKAYARSNLHRQERMDDGKFVDHDDVLQFEKLFFQALKSTSLEDFDKTNASLAALWPQGAEYIQRT